MNLSRRVDRLARQWGCAIHATPLQCPVCQPEAPIPPELTAAISSLIDRIIARLGMDESRACILSVPRPPRHEACPRCAGRRNCSACEGRYARAVFWAAHPTTAEQSQFSAMLALARELDAQRSD